MREYRIDFPLREQRLDRMLKEGLLYEFKYLKNINKNIKKLYIKKNAKN